MTATRSAGPAAPEGCAPDTGAPDTAVLVRARRAAGRRAVLAGTALAVAVVVVLGVSLAVGDYPISPGELLASAVGAGPTRVEFVLFRLRLPRPLAGLLVGASFGLAGALFQRVLRNPLASPDIIGVGAGASASAVVGLVVFGLAGASLSVAAVLGAVGAAALIYALARRGGLHGVRFVLIGVGVSSALLAIVSYLMTSASMTTAQEVLFWLTGSLGGVTWSAVVPLAAAAAVLVPAAVVLARALPRLELGDDTAAALGLPVERARAALLGVAVLLVGVAVGTAGPVSFVALVSGPLGARLAGTRGGGRHGLVHVALVGALLVGVSDLVARYLIGEVPLPVGVVTGALGAPYLLWLLARSRTRGGT